MTKRRAALALAIAMAFAACSNPQTLPPSASPAPTTEPTPTALPTPSSAPVPSLSTSPGALVDPADALQIAAPYELERPSSSDLEQVSGQIRGLPSDLAEYAGAGYSLSDFPLGVRFVRYSGNLVGVIALVAMPADVAELPGLLESIAAAAAAEANATLTYETIEGVKVGVVRGPIASTLAIVQGHLVMAQSGQPAVSPKDLMAAIITANDALGS